MVDVIVSRKFRLPNLNLRDEFHEFKNIVNAQIEQGLQLPYSVFSRDSLVPVKKYYAQLNTQSSLRERIHRCAAQSSYFILQQYRLLQENLLKIIDLKLSRGYFKDIRDDIKSLSYYELDNKLTFLNNRIVENIKIDTRKFYNTSVERVKFDNIKLDGDKIKKSFKNRGIRKLNKRFKELQSGSYSNSNYDSTILEILGLSNISSISSVSKKEWSDAKIRWKNTIDNLKISHFKTNWGEFKDDRQIIQSIFKNKVYSKYINGCTSKDFYRFVKLFHDEILIKQMVRYFKRDLTIEIDNYLRVIKLDLGKQIPSILKIPEYHSTSIPVGIDDGQVYQLAENFMNRQLSVSIKISLVAGQSQNVSIPDVSRYNQMLNDGFVAKRGILSFSHGKYYVHIPFSKKAMEKRDNPITAAVDLGLKTLAVISVFDKNKEIARQFLDQKHLGGSKSDWWVNPKMLPIKGKLMERRFEVKKQQSVRMQSTKGTKTYWYARNVEKSNWRKIKNSNMELVRQISTRICSYILHHDVSTLVLEDLKWSKHSPKSDIGYFLASWQLHWFFAQIQEMLRNMASLYGFTIEMVNPRYTSRDCWRCGERGNRISKIFLCTSDKCVRYQIDSDLNAARNLVLRSKKYKLILDAIRRKGRTP